MTPKLRIVIIMTRIHKPTMERNNYQRVAWGRDRESGEKRQLLVSFPKALEQYSPVLQGIKKKKKKKTKTQAGSLIAFQPCRGTSS